MHVLNLRVPVPRARKPIKKKEKKLYRVHTDFYSHFPWLLRQKRPHFPWPVSEVYTVFQVKHTYIIQKKRMNFIVARRMDLLSWSFIKPFPYKYKFSSSERWFKLFRINIGITSVASNTLLVAWKGHLNRKCFVFSAPILQRHMSEGVSIKLWRFLWLLSGLKPNLSWNKKRIPVGSWILKILLLFWRNRC